MSEDKMQIPEESVLDAVKRGKRFLQMISPEVAFNRDGDADLICILRDAADTIEALERDKLELALFAGLFASENKDPKTLSELVDLAGKLYSKHTKEIEE